MKTIANNPFRTLGVWSNAPASDIVTNKGRMSAFIRVGRQIDYPLDIAHILGPVERTAESITAADSQITVATERLLAAQFWFINLTPDDALAASHLAAGRTDEAFAIWNAHDDIASLQNRAILHLALGDTAAATQAIANLYSHHAEEFISTLHLNQPATAEQLVANYTSTIMAEHPDADLTALLASNADNTLGDAAAKGSAAPLIAQLSSAIDTAMQLRRQDAAKALEAGRQLAAEASRLMPRLKQILGDDDIELTSIADKAANEICECAVAHYNQANSRFAALDTAELVNAAEETAIGTMAKERVRKNSQSLIDILESLPPACIKEEHEAFYERLAQGNPENMQLSEVSNLIYDLKAILSKMTKAIGQKHPTAIACGSALVNYVLNITIDRVNEVLNSSTPYLLKDRMSEAETIFGRLNNVPVDEETRQRFIENRQKLENISLRLNNIIYSAPTSDTSGPEGCLIKFAGYVICAIIIVGIKTCNHKEHHATPRRIEVPAIKHTIPTPPQIRTHNLDAPHTATPHTSGDSKDHTTSKAHSEQ